MISTEDNEPKIVSIVSISSDARGEFKNKFYNEELMYTKLTITNYGGVGKAVISINIFDANNMPIGLAQAKVSINKGESILQIGIPIPTWASKGTASIYCNVFSEWPYEGGTPFIDEDSLKIQISLRLRE